MRILDCHSHWGTKRGYLFRTPEALARQEAIWRTKVEYLTEEEMCDEFVRHDTRAILDLSYPKFWPIEEKSLCPMSSSSQTATPPTTTIP